jgi:hypothetical protein
MFFRHYKSFTSFFDEGERKNVKPLVDSTCRKWSRQSLEVTKSYVVVRLIG